ncbi:MAG: TonB-dependent receptor [Bacteroidales bacterium]|nr:TonB-dependent receptor [Bacteroidales bacterium]MCB9013866.1 TonB-dependent receptor [Bacteroidales bacterium]
MIRNLFFTVLLFFISIHVSASGIDDPPVSYSISGHVSDAATGEVLIAANVYIRELGSGSVTNAYGYYSITLASGSYSIGVSYVGYQSFEKKILLTENQVLNIELLPKSSEIDEVTVSSVKKNQNVSSLEMGTTQLPIQSIRRIPAFMGEVDVIKAIQLLPGVTSTSEGSSGFSVRGGASDQNLILLDEATLYNASHMLGFFSIFNNDAIKDAKLYKGDIPASSGGRLSSLLEVRMKDGNTKQFSGTGGIGTISSRLTLEGPVFNEKTSFLLAGRRTYADVFLPLAKNKDIRDNKLYFYDLNAKINHTFNDNNRLYISSYFGRDVFKNQFAGLDFGNNTITIRWNHLFSSRLFSNFSLIHSDYDYLIATPEGEPNAFEWNSNLKDHSLKADFSYYANPVNVIKFGFVSTYHHFLPGNARGTGSESLFTELLLPDNYALEHGIYISSENKFGRSLSVKYGLRLSGFQNVGKATVYNFDANYNKIDSTVYAPGDFYNSYWGLEPRLGMSYMFSQTTSVKASYARTRQYVQLAQNSTAGTPLDIWFSAGKNIKPQISDQVSLGLFRNFISDKIETSVEVYYKKMSNTIDFKDHAFLLLNPELEGETRIGKSWSAGIEFLIKLNLEKLNGWIAYTYSRTERTIKGINNDQPYAAPYDKPNNVSVVLNYPFTDNIQLGLNWLYSTGNPVTFPTGRFDLMGSVLPIYSKRNEYRMPDYHRLDLSLTWSIPPKQGKKWQSEFNFSIYNAYGRHNAWAINFVPDETDPTKTKAELTYLFSYIPSITYNFKF